jgi:hypothetical protein
LLIKLAMLPHVGGTSANAGCGKVFLMWAYNQIDVHKGLLEQEILHYISQYSTRLGVHTNDSVVNLQGVCRLLVTANLFS